MKRKSKSSKSTATKKTKSSRSKTSPAREINQKKEQFLKDLSEYSTQVLDQDPSYSKAVLDFIESKPLDYFETLLNPTYKNRFRILTKRNSPLQARIVTYKSVTEYRIFSLQSQPAFVRKDGRVIPVGEMRNIGARIENLPSGWVTLFDGGSPGGSGSDLFTNLLLHVQLATSTRIDTFGVEVLSPFIFWGGREKSGITKALWEVDRWSGWGLEVEFQGEFVVVPPGW